MCAVWVKCGGELGRGGTKAGTGMCMPVVRQVVLTGQSVCSCVQVDWAGIWLDTRA